VSQQGVCNQLSEYDNLLQKARDTAEQFKSTAKEFIPKMYYSLRRENSNISAEDARDRIQKDCFGIWSKRTIVDALPDEAKNQEKQKTGRSRQKEHNSAALAAAPLKQKIMMVSTQNSIERQDSPVDETKTIADTSQTYNNENTCNLQPQQKPTNIENNTNNLHTCPNCEQPIIENQKIQNEKDVRIKEYEDEIQHYYNGLNIKIAENAGMQAQIDLLKKQQGKNENNSSMVSSSNAYHLLESSPIVDFEFSLQCEEVLGYAIPTPKVSGALGRLWFNGKIDKITGNVIAAYPGRISERNKIDNEKNSETTI
jgi:hypothetical protein